MKNNYNFSLLCIIISAINISAVYHTTFCMPTAHRDISYLHQVVESYKNQDIFRMDGVGLVVFDTDNSSLGIGIPLVNREIAICEPSEVDVEGIPSCRVRQQGLDVTTALMRCADITSGWVVLVEDDCEACAGALDEVISTLSTLNRNKIGIAKFSKFVRATAFPSNIINDYVELVRRKLYMSPYDRTSQDHSWSGDRTHYIHSRNLFHHIGFVSTEGKRNTIEFRAMYSDLRGDVCFETLS